MHRMILPIAVAIAATSFATAAGAQECDRNDETQSGLTICAGADFKASDKALNKSYGEIMRRLADDKDGRARLQAAQRAWIGFRDAECDFRTASTIGGSINPMMVAECRTELTDQRTEQLDVYLQCEEGDMACPVPAP